MSRPRDHIAQVTITFRVPAGFKAKWARALLVNANFATPIDLDYLEIEQYGIHTVKTRVGAAKVVKAPPRKGAVS